MATNDLKGRVDLDVAGALGALKSAQRAFRDLEKASTDAGQKMTASQRNATKAIIDEYAKLRKAQSQAVNDAIATERKMREIERNGVNNRRNTRAVTGAKVEAINTGAEDKSIESASRVALTTQRAITEEKRQQVMLADSEARRSSIALRDQLALRRQNLREQQAINRSQEDGVTSLNGMRYVLADVGQSMALLAVGAAVLPIATGAIAISWERDFANVIRTTQVTGKEIGLLKNQFVSLVTSMPVNWEDLTKIGTLAGQLGIAKQEIGSFTRTVAMFSATTDVSVEDSAIAFGRLNSLLPDVQGNFTMLGDAIAKVGVESVATEGQIVRITTQIAAIVGPAGFTAKEVIGLSGALASVGVPPELSRGVITRVFADITKAVSEGGIELEKWGQFIGVSGEQFRVAWNEDASGTFLKFMDGIQSKGNAAQLAIRDLGITSVRDVPILMRLGNAMSSTGEAGGLLAEAFDNAANSAGEMQRQYDIISGTTSAKLQVFVQTFQALIEAVGATALPMFSDILDDWSNSLRSLTRNLNEPIRLLGSIELPFTAGDAAAFAVITSAVVAGLALLLAAIARVVQASIAGKVALSTFRAHLAENAVAATANAAAMNSAALATGQFAAKTSIASRAAGGFRAVMGTITSAGFAAALIGVSFAIDAINTSLENVGSTGKEVANSILTASTALKALEEIEITGANASGGFGNPWEAQAASAKDFAKQLEVLDKRSSGFMALSGDTGAFADANAAQAVLDKLNKGYEQLIEAGNKDAVFGSVRGLSKELKLSDDAIARMIYNTPSLNALFKDTFNEKGIDLTEKNLVKLAKEGLAGFGVAAADATAEGAAFDEQMTEIQQQAQASLDALAGAAAGFFDFGSAIDAATEEGVLSLSAFMENIRAQAEAQATWQKNLASLAAQGATDAFMEYLVSMGPQAAGLIQEFVANPDALAEAQAIWQAHGADAALGWAASFQAQQQLAGEVGAAFGAEAKAELLARLAAGEDFNALLEEYKAKMAGLKTEVPPPSLSTAQQALDSWLYKPRSISVTVTAVPTNYPDAALFRKPFNGGYIGAGGYAGGGYTGDGGKFDPAGVVHRGEFVFTKKATSAIGISSLYDMMNAAEANGYAGGGKVMSSSASYVPSYGSSMGRSGGGGFSQMDAQTLQAILALGDRPIYLYTSDRMLATSVNNGGTQLARQGTN